MCQRFRRPALLFALLLGTFWAVPGVADSSGELEKALNTEYKGKTLALRQPQSGADLFFDVEGKRVSLPLRTTEPLFQYWTFDGVLRVKRVRLDPKSVHFEATRLLVIYDPRSQRFQIIPTGFSCKITLELGNSEKSIDALHTLIYRVFLRPDEHYPEGRPTYWEVSPIRPAMASAEVRRPGSPADEKGASAVPPASSHPVTAPRAITTPDPMYTPEAREHLAEGVVALWVSVNDQGRVSNVIVAEPLGMGLTETAIDAVRHWSFHPSMTDGQPTSAIIRIEIHFRCCP